MSFSSHNDYLCVSRRLGASCRDEEIHELTNAESSYVTKAHTAAASDADVKPRDELLQLFTGPNRRPRDEAERIRSDATESDAALIVRLRGGDITAYTALWVKHVDAALRMARRLAPNQAEDLVSEGFIALYQQIAVKKNGPDSAFRAYLFTVIRNISTRWYREGRLVDTTAEIEVITEDDGLSRLEEKTDAEGMLLAFRALPERWQRVLWLVEVDEVARPDIAQEFGIKPNAVSVLYRRARNGLRLSWLEQQIPKGLRQSSDHVAQQLPKLLMSRHPGSPSRDVASHLSACDRCNTLYAELQTTHRRMTSGTLAVAGFAALGVALPASSASLTALGVGGGALLIGGVGIGATLLAASVSLLIAGGTLTAGLPLADNTQDSATKPSSQQDTGDSSRSTEIRPPAETSPSKPRPGLGRGNHDDAVSSITFSRADDPNDFHVPPPRPNTAGGPLLGPGSDPTTPLRSGITNPGSSQDYLAPKLSGTTLPGATIFLELHIPASNNGSPARTEQYVVPVEASGAWSLDARTIATETAGTYDYIVWAARGEITSPADTGQFKVHPLGVTGFESIPPFEMIPIDEASTSGVVIQLEGAPNGMACLSSVYSGQTATVQLNSSGSSIKRLKMLTGGSYLFSLRACDGQFRGPAFEQFIDVDDPSAPIFGPFGPDPADIVFELTDP